MHAVPPSTMTEEARNERRGVMDANQSAVNSAIREFFHPCVLAIFCLAIAAGSWGYAYKLLRYQGSSQNISRASVVRLWVDDNRGQLSAAASHNSTRSQRIPGSHPFACSIPRLPRLSSSHAFTGPAPARAVFIFSPLIPFRAPPLEFSLA